MLNQMQNPGDSFVRAAKMGLSDDLQGSLESLAWGKTPSIGTGSSFDIMYSGKVMNQFSVSELHIHIFFCGVTKLV